MLFQYPRASRAFFGFAGNFIESKALIRIAFFPFLYSSWPLSDCDNLLDEPFEPTDPPPLVPHGLPPPLPELLEEVARELLNETSDLPDGEFGKAFGHIHFYVLDP